MTNLPHSDNTQSTQKEEIMKKNVVRKWYNKLSFPDRYNEEFELLIENTPISAESIETWDYKTKTPEENALAYLYFCEALEKKYEALGIPEKILLDTLSDLVIWTNTHCKLTGKFGLSETAWLYRHLSFKLFRLGRLQFCMADSEFSIEEIELLENAPVVEVHIPEGEPLPIARCKESFILAEQFFAKYFPSYEYSVYTCHSWLLDPSIIPLVGEESNIAAFKNLFKTVRNDDSDALLKYIFHWNARREDINELEANTTLARKVKAAVLRGEKFHESLGYILK